MPDEQRDSGTVPEPTGFEAPTAAEPPILSQAPVPAPPEHGYDATGVPTFDSIRERIENRYGTAVGATELAQETPEGRSVQEQFDARQRAAAERLAQIKKSLESDS